MPHIDVKMYPGRTKEAKESMAKKLQETLVQELGCPESAVSVSVEDVAPEVWKAEVADQIQAEDLLIGSDFV